MTNLSFHHTTYNIQRKRFNIWFYCYLLDETNQIKIRKNWRDVTLKDEDLEGTKKTLQSESIELADMNLWRIRKWNISNCM